MDVAAGALGAVIGVGLVALAIAIFVIVCTWKIYVKMGAPGWASIIPYYTNWVLCEKVWGNALVSLAIIVPGVINMVVDLGGLATVLSLITVVTSLITNWKMCKGFGKGTGFCIANIFFAPITMAILAFGKDEFVGPAVNATMDVGNE